jgi:hypothetical protein
MNKFHSKFGTFPDGNTICISNQNARKPKKLPKIIGELESLCHSIIQNCKHDRLQVALDKIDKLSLKLDEIDDNTILECGTSALREMIIVLKMVQSVNTIAVAKGCSISFKKEMLQTLSI